MLHILDLRHALRRLRRSPFFTLLTIVVLSGGLGLAIFTFSFLNTAMLKPIPVRDGDRIVRISQASLNASGGLDAADAAHMRAGLTGHATLEAVGAYTTRSAILGDVEHPRSLVITVAESNIFTVTHTTPMLGRGLRLEDQATRAEPVIVLSYDTWKSAFGRDSAIVGTTIPLNGALVRVVGVMPEGYGFPVAAEAWMALSDDVLAARTRDVASLDLYARLASGVTARRAAVELNVLFKRAQADVPDSAKAAAIPASILVQTFPMAQLGDEGPLMFIVLNLLAVLILLLACINVTNLLLARANERARETAIRLALGASRLRLITQNLWESILLCLAGGVLATALAAWGLDAINALARANLEGNLAFWWVWRLDRAGLVAAGAFVTVTMTVLGGVVAVRASNRQLNAVLNSGSARAGGQYRDRLARALVVTQVATVTVLMFFGVLSGIVGQRVANVDFGYDTARLLRGSFELPVARYASQAASSAFFDRAIRELDQAPAIESALLQSNLAAMSDDAGRFEIRDGRSAATAANARAYIQGVLGALGTLGVSVTAGRAFDSRDDARGAGTAIVSRSLGTKYWPNGSPIGAQLLLNGETSPRTVVGVVSDVLLGNPLSRNRSADAVYVPLRQIATNGATIQFRSRGDAAAARAAVYRSLSAADPLVAPPTIQTYDDVAGKLAMMARFVVRLFTFCFGFALLLAVSGTYGLMSRSIGQRTRELGVRRALGATDQNVVKLLLKQGSSQLGIGVLFALPAMFLVGVGFAHFLPIGTWLSLGAGALVSVTIVSVVLLATYLPTRRALGVPLRDALRGD